MLISYSRVFGKQYQKAPLPVKDKFRDRLSIFKVNPNDNILRNHSLSGNYRGLRSINITGDWRALYREVDKTTVVFEIIGTHNQLYN